MDDDMTNESQTKFSSRDWFLYLLIMISIWLAIVPPLLLTSVDILDYLKVAAVHSIFIYVTKENGKPFAWLYLGYIALWPFIATVIASQINGSIFTEYKALPFRTKVWKILADILAAIGVIIFILLFTSNTG